MVWSRSLWFNWSVEGALWFGYGLLVTVIMERGGQQIAGKDKWWDRGTVLSVFRFKKLGFQTSSDGTAMAQRWHRPASTKIIQVCPELRILCGKRSFRAFSYSRKYETSVMVVLVSGQTADSAFTV